MMNFEIQLNQIGRRFNQDWIFKHIDYQFLSGHRYAILGRNGSGKSTLLKVISGSLTPSEGSISFFRQGQPISIDEVFQHISIAAPYMELIEEFTLEEMLNFHFKFKAFLSGFDRDRVIATIGLEKALHKPIRFFSSGMKQRVKLALACTSHSDVLMLDEPTSNLDHHAIAWYHELLAQTVKEERILIICSNQPEEYKTCSEFLELAAIAEAEAEK